MNKSVNEIARRVGGIVKGNAELRITGVSGVEQACEGDLAFVRDAGYDEALSNTRASAVLAPPGTNAHGKTLIELDNPEGAFALLLQEYAAELEQHFTGIHPAAVVGENAALGEGVALGADVVLAGGCEIGDGAVLYPGVYVGRDARVGPGTILYPRVTIMDRVVVGARCILHAGVVLGADGFGFSVVDGVWRKIPQLGTVVVGDDVEIGANSAIDRATFGSTEIGDGTKIDNLVQIGHNVRVGRHCIIAGEAGIAGSATLGDHVAVGARAGIGGHLSIGAGTKVAALSAVTKSIGPGCTVSGAPAMEHRRSMRIQAGQRMVPEALRRLRNLERHLQEGKQRADGKTADDC